MAMQRQLQNLVGENMEGPGILSLELDARISRKGAVTKLAKP